MDPRLADMDPAELFTRLSEKLTTADAMHRTLIRAQRGKELYAWGLSPQYADPNSSLAADDAGFMNEYTGDMVSATARFPIMNAIDCLCATAELIEWRPKSRDSHTTSILAQCRTAMESAATTIWLLSDRDRQMRRGLSVRFTTSDLRKSGLDQPTPPSRGGRSVNTAQRCLILIQVDRFRFDASLVAPLPGTVLGTEMNATRASEPNTMRASTSETTVYEPDFSAIIAPS